MPSLLSQAEIDSYKSAMKDLHDTFARDIIVYQTAKKTVISTNVNHNFIYGGGGGQTEVEETVVANTCKARIHYPKESKLEQFLRAGGSRNDDQIQLKRKDFKVKLVVEEDVKEILQSCERVEFDGIVYTIESDLKPHGVIGVQFYDFYLQAVN